MKLMKLPDDFGNGAALTQAAATITAALIARADPRDEITTEWIASAFAQAYAALLISPPQVEKEYKLAIQTPGGQPA
jgi:hypothetical protein